MPFLLKENVHGSRRRKTSALPKLAFSTAETAVVLGISYVSVIRLLKWGLLKSSNALRTKVIARSEIERFLAA